MLLSTSASCLSLSTDCGPNRLRNRCATAAASSGRASRVSAGDESESLGALRAALANQLQRCVNLLLGSVLANISLTIPAVLTVGLISGQTIILGLPPVELTLLLLTLGVSALTFSNTRSNVLLGAVHLILFVAYLMLIFES